MGRSERELVAVLRAELAAIDPARACDRRAEIAGLIGAPAVRRTALARLSHRLGRASAAAASGTSSGDAAAGDAGIGGFDWDSARSHCRIAWFRGLFLARGTLSLSAGRTHLEFVVPTEEAQVLAARLTELDLPAAWRIRRGHGVVTWKSGE